MIIKIFLRNGRCVYNTRVSDKIFKTNERKCKLAVSSTVMVVTSDDLFSHDLQLSSADILLFAVVGPVLLIIRAVLAGVYLVVGYSLGLLGYFVLLRNTDLESRPLSEQGCVPDSLQQFIWLLCGRGILYLLGFRITVKGRQASRSEAPILVIGPHTSFLDVLVVCLCRSSPVARRETWSKWWRPEKIWDLAEQIIQSIFVRRSSGPSRRRTTNKIISRARSSLPWPQISVFPEGSTSNGSALARFMSGAFRPGVPVQPVTIQYSRPELFIWTFNQSHSALYSLLMIFMNPSNHVTITFLPVYTPTQQEKDDSFLFADNVQKVIGDHLEIPCTDLKPPLNLK